MNDAHDPRAVTAHAIQHQIAADRDAARTRADLEPRTTAFRKIGQRATPRDETRRGGRIIHRDVQPDVIDILVRAGEAAYPQSSRTRRSQALAECGCVDSACRRVGISTTAAYALRGQVRAQSFRLAWDMALDHAFQRLSDAAYSQAIYGVVQPIFYKGEQVGECRRYDERLTMFLLRYRNPERYGAWMDTCRAERAPDAATISLGKMLDHVAADAYAEADGAPLPPRMHRYTPPIRFVSAEEQEEIAERQAAACQAAEDRRERASSDAAFDEWLATRPDSSADVPATSAGH